MRKKIVGSSWKMHINSIKDGVELAKEIRNYVGEIEEADVFILPTFPMIKFISDVFKGSKIKWGAQNVCFEEKGAYTGEVPIQVLKELGCSYVELGHAERRALFNESDEVINKKVKLCIKHNLVPIVCIGETQEDLNNDVDDIRLKTQILWALEGINKEEAKNVIFAYEPVWAIGQKEAAEAEYVRNVHEFIRKVISDIYGSETSEEIRIIYGGSVSPESAKVLTKYDEIDGLFIGRFGLKAENFKSMVETALR
jgi:triosephosphate isomerase (TIM)